jgi:outer membrane protein assembly factor BamB
MLYALDAGTGEALWELETADGWQPKATSESAGH